MCSCPPRTPEQLEQAKNLVLEVAANIAQEKFPAIESQSCPCDFPEHCPYYRHLYTRGESLPSPQAKLAVITEDTVEQYVSLQKQLKELQSQLDEVKQRIITFCQAEGLNRVYGNEHALTYKLVERTGFDEDEVRALLEQVSLWERVLSFDPSRVKQLLADEKVAADIRAKLEALKQITVTSQLWARKRTAEED